MPWTLTEEMAMDEAYESAHPACEHCENTGCVAAKCPHACCDYPKLVVPPSEEKFNFSAPLLIHEGCVAAFEAGDEPPYQRRAVVR